MVLLNIVKAGVISTSIVIIVGFAMITPIFMNIPSKTPQNVLLFFYVNDYSDVTDWCRDLVKLLDEKGFRATIFFTGIVAEQYPDCVALFGESIDVGSQTYSHVNLSSIDDYNRQLIEVQKGKRFVDDAGNLDSRLFHVPMGFTNDNIYSLLSRSGILADFSYKSHYNKYHDGKFLYFNATFIHGLNFSQSSLRYSDDPCIIFFDNSVPVSEIREALSHLVSSDLRLINASDLTGLELTIRDGEAV